MSHTPSDHYTTFILRVPDAVGALAKILCLFEQHAVNMTRITSHPASDNPHEYDLSIDVEGLESDSNLLAVMADLKKTSARYKFLGGSAVPWYPRHPQDLDMFTHKTLDYGSELEADHPGFNDPVYRARRAEIVASAQTYRYGQPLPRIEYKPDEIATWGIIYRQLKKMYPGSACKQFNHVFPLLEQNCGYSDDCIPQLEDVSSFLKKCTGWSLRPVMGLLTARDFLNGLAFRVFHSTQYIRHPSTPFYTPEPDVCHELLGHVPMYCDPAFAAFSQEIGLASLGASDADIEKLATLYWFTIEFGVCKQDGKPKAYGAGLLSSFGELEYCMTDKPDFRPLDVHRATTQKYPITEYQPVYFVAESFESATEKVRDWVQTMDRKFAVHYNPYTQRVEVIDNKDKLMNRVREVASELASLHRTLELYL